MESRVSVVSRIDEPVVETYRLVLEDAPVLKLRQLNSAVQAIPKLLLEVFKSISLEQYFYIFDTFETGVYYSDVPSRAVVDLQVPRK